MAVITYHPTDVQVHCLDADAIALEAARTNVAAAARVAAPESPPSLHFHLSDGMGETQAASSKHVEKASKRTKMDKSSTFEGIPVCDWIVSNPPVHRGLGDDFTVSKHHIIPHKPSSIQSRSSKLRHF